MIRLTRLNNRQLVVNSDLIKFIENAPDTLITLASGEKIVVLETAEEVISRIVEYRRRLRGPIAAIVPLENVDDQLAEEDDPAMRKEPERSPQEDE